MAGSDNVVTVFKQTRNLAPKQAILDALCNVFGVSKKAVAFHAADDSGTAFNPYSQSKVEPHNRIFYLQHKTLVAHLSGSSLNELTRRFLDVLRNRIVKSSIGSEWEDMPDLHSFLQLELFQASVEAMCGPNFLRLSPNFPQEFWEFDRCTPDLFKGYPRWVKPQSYRALEKVLKSVKQWHASAREHYDANQTLPNNEDWDDYYGSKLIKERLEYCKKMEPMDADAVASEDLGLLWA